MTKRCEAKNTSKLVNGESIPRENETASGILETTPLLRSNESVGSLSSELFTDLDPAQEEAFVAPQAGWQYNITLLWPANVPALEYACRAISGDPQTPEVFQAVTKMLLENLGTLEKTFLDSTAPTYSVALHKAYAVRWRIAIAVLLKPELGKPIDSNAAGALISEIDSAMMELKHQADTTQEIAAAHDAARAFIAKEAVAFSEQIHQYEKSIEQQAVALARQRFSPVTTAAKLVVTETASPKRQKKGRFLLYGALVVSLIAAICFHGIRLSSTVKAPRPLLTDFYLPPGAVALPFVKDMITVTTPKPLTPEEKKKFKQSVVAVGKEFSEVSPSNFIISLAKPHGKNTRGFHDATPTPTKQQ